MSKKTTDAIRALLETLDLPSPKTPDDSVVNESAQTVAMALSEIAATLAKLAEKSSERDSAELLAAIGALPEALRVAIAQIKIEQPKPPAPQVSVAAPSVTVQAPNVTNNYTPPAIKIPPAVVQQQSWSKLVVKVTGYNGGRISEFQIEKKG